MNNKAFSAKILVEALPYIQKYFNKTIVIKYGGNAMTSETLRNEVMKDVILLSIVGIKVVLVHGGGPEIDAMLKKIGKEPHFINGLRYTDKETAEIVEMVLAGKVNKDLVSLIHNNNGKAIGLCGIDGNMIQTKKRKGAEDLGYVGDIAEVDITPIVMALENGFVPVIASVGADKKGQVYNMNADVAASAVARALKAEKIIFMTDIRGVLVDKDDEDTLIQKIRVDEVEELMDQGIISGGMIPKIGSCVHCVDAGVGSAVIIDGRIEHSLLLELFSDEGIGTLIVK